MADIVRTQGLCKQYGKVLRVDRLDQTRGLCKQYGKVLRVDHLDLQVPEGAIYGFLGPNGAGKSTTLKMILGLVHPTAGSISVFGKEVNGHKRSTGTTAWTCSSRWAASLRAPATTATSPGRRI